MPVSIVHTIAIPMLYVITQESCRTNFQLEGSLVLHPRHLFLLVLIVCSISTHKIGAYTASDNAHAEKRSGQVSYV